MSQATLYLMLGYPGAGKTTVAKMIAEVTGATHLSSDNFRLHMFPKPVFSEAEHTAVYGALDYMTELLLKNGVSVIYDANLNRYQYRKEKYDICAQVDAKPVLVWLNTPRDTAETRAVNASKHHLVPPNETPEVMFRRIAAAIDVPTAEEDPIELDGSHLLIEDIRQAL